MLKNKKSIAEYEKEGMNGGAGPSIKQLYGRVGYYGKQKGGKYGNINFSQKRIGVEPSGIIKNNYPDHKAGGTKRVKGNT
jgi:hypothetical protein